MTTRWRATAAALLVAGLVLGACSDGSGQEPSTSLPEPTTASASPTLPPLGPADFPMPQEAREQTPEGAEAFIRYYLGLWNLANETLDPTYLEQLSDPACGTCTDVNAEYRKDEAAGFSYEGGGITIDSIAAPTVEGNEARVAFYFSQAAVSVLDSAGSPVPDRTYTEFTDISSGATLQWTASDVAWRVASLTLG